MADQNANWFGELGFCLIDAFEAILHKIYHFLHISPVHIEEVARHIPQACGYILLSWSHSHLSDGHMQTAP